MVVADGALYDAGDGDPWSSRLRVDAQLSQVHWHAFSEVRTSETPHDLGREDRLARAPLAVLRSASEVADWIEARTREHVHPREVFAVRDGEWVTIGDDDDLAHLYLENMVIALRGDSIYTDIFSDGSHHDLFVEAVTRAQCGCVAE